MRIAIVGTGIAGMVAAYLLSRDHDITVFEANDYIGGHTHTVPVKSNGSTYPIDTGFVVFNHVTYPNFSRLLERLDVPSEPTQMSFSVKSERTGLEYNGTSLNGLFAQRSNLLRPGFYRMIHDILRFYRESPSLLADDADDWTLGDYLDSRKYSKQFVEEHIVPMGSAIWSADPSLMRQFPARYFVQFFSNHGFLKLKDRPQWRIIRGGSWQYVARLTAPYRKRIRLSCPIKSITRNTGFVEITPRTGDSEGFDSVVIATHSDQALRLLADPGEREHEILSRIPYQSNQVVLHSDSSLLPRRRLARAAWNYHLNGQDLPAPTVTYFMNQLQNLRADTNFCVTLNRTPAINTDTIIRQMVYDHPIFTHRSVQAQKRHSEINGANRTFYCGAYWGYGFHEDGVNSALEVCRQFGVRL